MNNNIVVSDRLQAILYNKNIGAHYEQSHKRWNVRYHLPNDITAYDDYVNAVFETVGGIAIHIPEDKIKNFEYLIDNEFKICELEVRNRYPGVQKAWEHYQMLLKLTGEI